MERPKLFLGKKIISLREDVVGGRKIPRGRRSAGVADAAAPRTGRRGAQHVRVRSAARAAPPLRRARRGPGGRVGGAVRGGGRPAAGGVGIPRRRVGAVEDAV